MEILVCGGAGYVGSHIVKLAIEKGHGVTVVDNLSTGHEKSVMGAKLLQGDIGDRSWIEALMRRKTFDLVMHFCAYSLVGESFDDPVKYYDNNVGSTLMLLRAMLETGHKKLIFSSTAAVYGELQELNFAEDHPKNPISPYGKSKWMVEQILQDFASAYDFSSVCLRYFNAAGADPAATIGEKHSPETHLIPNILRSVASGGNLKLKVFGTDYPTPDGSCLRDYIHVNDLASAHLLAGEFLQEEIGAHAFNLGNGQGFSVLEVISAARKVTGEMIEFESCERRVGDPSVLVANASAARDVLGWDPRYIEIEKIIETAWIWHKKGEQFV